MKTEIKSIDLKAALKLSITGGAADGTIELTFYELYKICRLMCNAISTEDCLTPETGMHINVAHRLEDLALTVGYGSADRVKANWAEVAAEERRRADAADKGRGPDDPEWVSDDCPQGERQQ